ncbi:MAG: TrmH family RNA methyltransferase [Nanoarchaeota archaeon]|nr:TrmH family RNA methyltransferase [Nanoarchaeota archaeon]
MINHLLYDLGNPANIGGIIRLIHVLGGKDSHLYIFDPRANLTTYEREISKASTGLYPNPKVNQIDNIDTFLNGYQGRKIATQITPRATKLTYFKFQLNDLVIYGNENRGIPQQIIDQAQESIIIPMLGQTYRLPRPDRPVAENYGEHPNLNVAHAAAIIAYEALKQTGSFEDFKLE